MSIQNILEEIDNRRCFALKEYLKSKRGVETSRDAYEADEDIFANYYDEDSNFIFEKMGDITEHYIEQQEYLYYQAFLDCIEMMKKTPEMLTNLKFKELLCEMRG